MNCAEVRDRLDECDAGVVSKGWPDGVESHLRECARCRAHADELRALLGRAARLPREAEPARDLWPGIAAAIAAGEAPRAAGRAASRRRLLATAAIVVAAAGVALVAGVRIGRNQPGAAGPGAVPAIAGAGLDEATREFERARGALRATLLERRASLDARTLEVVEANLRLIDESAAAIRRALEARPGDPGLGALLMAARRQEIELLQQATQLPGRA